MQHGVELYTLATFAGQAGQVTVAVVGGNESLYGQSHVFAEKSGGDVAEVSAGYTDDQLVGLA